MLFLLHIVLLLHGAFGLVVAKVRTTEAFDYLPGRIIDLINQVWPDTVYKVWKEGVDEPIAEPGQALGICAAQIGYSVYYLNKKHRG
jgi:hypothetical protein